MARLRLILAWLLLAALPLQGFAAAGVLQCGPAQKALAAVAQHVAGADHHARDGHHAHAPGAHHVDHDAHASQAPAGGDDHGATFADAHNCFACAAACHGVGLTGEAAALDVAPAPQAHAAEPFRHFDSRPPPVPDKPPRA